MDRFVSPKEMAQAIGVSESSLKRWVDNGLLEVSRTAGGHRRIPVSSAVQFIRNRGHSLVRPEVLGFTPALASSDEAFLGKSPEYTLTELLKSGKLLEARSLIFSLFMEGMSVAEIADGPICHALEEIGTIWHNDERGIIIEHRSVECCIYSLNILRGLIDFRRDSSQLKALGCSLEGDPYLLPSLLTSIVLIENEFDATNLGPDLPLEILRGEVNRMRPDLVWLSVTAMPNVPDLTENIGELCHDLITWGGMMVIGGRNAAAITMPESPALKICSSMQSLAETARWLSQSRSSDSLPDTGSSKAS